MKMTINKIIMPEYPPIASYDVKPRMSGNNTGWHKSRGYMVPVDSFGRVAPRCIFDLRNDGLFRSNWISTQWWNDNYMNALPWNTVRSEISRGHLVADDDALSYDMLVNMVKRAYGRSYDTSIQALTAKEMYAEFGAILETSTINAINMKTNSDGTGLTLTVLSPIRLTEDWSEII